ncbi:MAG: bifunctional adenosylcobinamide kinase/adenosylcobinamide-phosphate guanylyltransferase [Xenococcaceae cyanobacterium]
MNQEKLLSRQIILVTGAARSGKSEWAETLATEMGKPVIYIATAQADSTDKEWQARIEKHRLRRPSSWQTLLVPVELAAIIGSSVPSKCLLVDSLGTWVANLLNQDEGTWEKTAAELLKSLQQATVDVILVAEETGWGVVPAYAAGRQFRDRLGMLVRQIGAIADGVYLVTGGHVLNLSLLGKPLKKSEF